MKQTVAGAARRVSVIIPHYRDLAGLSRCLAALERQTYPKEAFEIVVADNASPEGEAAVSAVIAGRARLVVIPEKGAGPARNGAVAQSQGELLAFTDADCEPQPQWLDEGVRALASSNVVGGAMRVLVSDVTRLAATEAFEMVFAFDNEAYVKRKGFSVTANLFCARSTFDAVGGFRTGVPEDLEWCHRARSAGQHISYAPSAVVGHPPRRSWADLKNKWRRLNSEAYALHRMNGRSRARWIAISLALPLSAIAHSPRVLMSDRLTSLDQKARALLVLHRLRAWRMLDSLRLLAKTS